MELHILGIRSRRSGNCQFGIFVCLDFTLASYATQTVGNDRLLLVCVAIEHIIVSYNILVLEVEHKCWIESYTAEACLEVEVRTSASSGVASKTDGLSCFHYLVFSHKVL